MKSPVKICFEINAINLVTSISCPVWCSEEVAALILARGGSKAVRLKNLQTVGGVSLLRRAINIALKAGLTDVTVSTDHPAIALEALKSGASLFHRSRITATDSAPSIWGAAEFLYAKPHIKVLVLIQATSPFIQASYVRNAVNKLNYPKPYDCVFSVTRSYKLRWQYVNSDCVSAINFKVGARPRRQDWNGELVETGAFYISRRILIENGSFQNNNCTVLETSYKYSLEVDSYYDLQVADVLLKSNLV